jgi:hypothetical protein
MSKAAHGFSPEAYLKYVEGGNPWRTPLIGKIAIYGWKLTKLLQKEKENEYRGSYKNTKEYQRL